MKNAYRVNIFMLVTVIILLYGKLLLNNLGIFKSMGANMSTVLTQVVFLLYPIILYIAITKNKVFESLRIKSVNFKSALTVFLVGALAVPIIIFVSSLLMTVSKSYTNDIVRFSENGKLLTRIISIALVPAVIEELLFRGIFLYEYRNVKSIISIVINGILYGLVFGNVYIMIIVMLLGALFSYIVLITDSVIYSIIVHFVIAALIIILLSAVNFEYALSTLSAYKLMTIVILFLAALICGIIMFFVLKKFSGKQSSLEKVDEFIENEEDAVSAPLICAVIFSVGYLISPNIIVNVFFIITVLLAFIFLFMLAKMNE